MKLSKFKMKELILLITALVLTACSENQYDGGFAPVNNAYIETREDITHYQNCYFSSDMVIHNATSGGSIAIDSGTTMIISDAKDYWYSGDITQQLVIELGTETRRDTTMSTEVVDQFQSTDTLKINVYHAGVCSVWVD